ncbi:MAG: hypothetical protein HC822_04540 [Oscillochloris sp.]|nr:hypothetical protein [Oscillochloris sp.]
MQPVLLGDLGRDQAKQGIAEAGDHDTEQAKATPSAIAPYEAPMAIAERLSEVTRLAAVSWVLRA